MSPFFVQQLEPGSSWRLQAISISAWVISPMTTEKDTSSGMTERPADTERDYDNWNFSDSLGCVDRWSSYGNYFARVDVRDNDLSPRDG
jgi:hypothetical protein